MKDYWHPHRREQARRFQILASVLIVAAFCAGMAVGNQFGERTIIVQDGEQHIPSDVHALPVASGFMADKEPLSLAVVMIPALDEDDNGITTTMSVQAFPGSGRILTNIDELLFWVDTQNSIRRATQVAENVTGVNFSTYDVVYTIQANASVIGGPSAGAAITVATMAALTNRSINNSVMITGAVNHDGTIGPVGAILQKALAAKEAGASLFLVPMTQSSEIT
jgi:predicted S18 family serine protease